jgi:hypothetical protein
LPEQIRGARAALAEMSDEGRTRLEPLMPHFAALDAEGFFDFVVERTIAALAEMAERR